MEAIKPGDVHHIQHKAGKSGILLFLAIFGVAVFVLFVIYLNFPELEPQERAYFKLPRDIEDAKQLGQVLSRYKDRYFWTVTCGFFFTYIFLQSFAIPGSIFLSILSGFLFPFPMALLLVCSCSAIGASFCYLLSFCLGRTLILKHFPEKAATWSQHVERHRQHLLNYMIFLRVTPILPNWFINMAAPVIGVPMYPFVMGTFLGVAPPSFVAIQAGTTLHTLTSSRDAVSWTSVALLCVFGVISILPAIFKNQFRNKLE